MGSEQEISRPEQVENSNFETHKRDVFELEDDPHRAALEDNPEVAERPSWSTCLAVLVSSVHCCLQTQHLLFDVLYQTTR